MSKVLPIAPVVPKRMIDKLCDDCDHKKLYHFMEYRECEAEGCKCKGFIDPEGGACCTDGKCSCS